MSSDQRNFLFVFDLDGEAGPVPEPLPVADAEESIGAGHSRRGYAGQYLTVADIMIRGFDGFIMDGLDADVVANIAGLRQFQVKSTMNIGETFGRVQTGSRPNFRRKYGRTLDSYKGKIDAFAFVLLPRRLVYYFHIDAIGSKSLTPPDSCWTVQACNHSFAELLRRFRGEPA
jgi:hypothetical protein